MYYIIDIFIFQQWDLIISGIQFERIDSNFGGRFQYTICRMHCSLSQPDYDDMSIYIMVRKFKSVQIKRRNKTRSAGEIEAGG